MSRRETDSNSSDWKVVAFTVIFSAWRLALRDYWGTAFGSLLAFCLAVRSTRPSEAPAWRRNAYRFGVSVFVVLALVALWKSIPH